MSGDTNRDNTRKRPADDLNGAFQVAAGAVALVGVYGLAATFVGEFETWNSPMPYLVAAGLALAAFVAGLMIGPKLGLAAFDRTRTLALVAAAGLLLGLNYFVAHARAGQAKAEAEKKTALEVAASRVKEVKEKLAERERDVKKATAAAEMARNAIAQLESEKAEAEKTDKAKAQAIAEQIQKLKEELDRINRELEAARNQQKELKSQKDKLAAALKDAADKEGNADGTTGGDGTEGDGGSTGADKSDDKSDEGETKGDGDRLSPFSQAIKALPFGDLVLGLLKAILPMLGGVEDRDLPDLAKAVSTMIQDGGVLGPLDVLRMLKETGGDPDKLAARLQEKLRAFLAVPANREKLGEKMAKKLDGALKNPPAAGDPAKPKDETAESPKEGTTSN